MTNLEQWLALAEQHARQMVATRISNRPVDAAFVKEVKQRFHVMNTQSHQMARLWRNLRAEGYAVPALDALYDARCESIIGRKVQR